MFTAKGKMKDQYKTKKQLVDELGELRRKVSDITKELEARGKTVPGDWDLETPVKEVLQRVSEKSRELDAIINNSPAIVFLWRAAEGWPVEYVSDNIQQFGYTPEDFYMERVHFADIVHTDDLERVANEVRQYSQEGNKEFFQKYRIITKSGDIRWLYDHTWVRRDSKDIITHYQGIVTDTTERKEAEMALEESEYKFQNLSDEVSDGVAVTMNGKNYWVNKAFAKIFGYTKEELIGQGLDFLVIPEEVPKLLRQMKDRLAGKKVPSYYNTIARCKDGRKINLGVSAKVIRYENEQAIQIVVRDITDWKLAAKKIENLNRMYATLSGVNTALVQIRDRGRLFKEVCKIAVEKGKFRMVWVGVIDEKTKLVKPVTSRGYVRGYFDGMSISTKDVAIDQAPVVRVLKEGKIVVNQSTEDNQDLGPWKKAMLKRKYRSTCHIPIREGKIVIGVLNLCSEEPDFFDEEEIRLAEELAEDISFGLGHMKAERNLRDSEGKFRSVIEESNDGIYVVIENRFVFINPRFTEITGFREREICNKDFNYRNLVAEEGQQILDERETIRKQGQTPPNRYEFKGLRKDGRVIDLETSISLIEWDGKPATLGIIRDITARIQIRKDLEQALEKANQANKVKSLFIANMSHEIRTPLNSILGFTDIIRQETKHLLDKENHFFFETVQKSGERLMNTVHEILDISQIEAGTLNLNRQELDLNELIEEIVREFELIAQNKGLKISFNSSVSMSTIICDEYCISQALTNLLDNAVKYTEAGSVQVDLKRKADELTLTIQDTGIGISDEYMDNIFEVFSQESSGYTKEFQGLGLGLALTKRYLDLNNIAVSVRSVKNVGTTFSLTFNTVDEVDSERNAYIKDVSIPDVQVLGGEKRKVLVVEDDPDSQKLITYYLRKKYTLALADSVKTAKSQLDKQPVDLVLLDLSLLGEEDGLDLARYMRQSKKWKQVPIVALTAHVFTTDRDKCLAVGCNDFLTKPIRRKALLDNVDRLIEGR